MAYAYYWALRGRQQKIKAHHLPPNNNTDRIIHQNPSGLVSGLQDSSTSNQSSFCEQLTACNPLHINPKMTHLTHFTSHWRRGQQLAANRVHSRPASRTVNNFTCGKIKPPFPIIISLVCHVKNLWCNTHLLAIYMRTTRHVMIIFKY